MTPHHSLNPSRVFFEAFREGAGAPQIVCVCGRSHYAPDSQHITKEQRDEMLGHANARPDRVVLHERNDSVLAREINGITVVPECPCQWLARFERLIWNERTRILKYYELRRSADLAALERLDSELKTVAHER